MNLLDYGEDIDVSQNPSELIEINEDNLKENDFLKTRQLVLK